MGHKGIDWMDREYLQVWEACSLIENHAKNKR